MLKSGLLSLVLLLHVWTLSAQQYAVSGIVKDAETGEALIGATVYEPGVQRGTTTNENGYFNLVVPAGYRYLEFRMTGYLEYGDSLYVGSDKEWFVELMEDEYFEEIEIDESDTRIPDEIAIPRPQSTTQAMVRNVPPVFGEIDLIKSIQFLPGIQGGIEGSAGFHVRGGSPDQNLIQIDGVPVYNINHTFGFFSSFNTESVLSYRLYKGGFPAQFGSRLSSVLDISLKDGNYQEFHASAGISLIGFYGYLEGPLVENKTTLSASLRRTVPGLIYIANPVARGSDGERNGGHFYDGTIKLTHRFSDKSKLSLTYYRGLDKFYSDLTNRSDNSGVRVEDKRYEEVNWGNNTLALRWSNIFSSRLYGAMSLSYTSYKFNQEAVLSRTEATDTSKKESELALYYYSGIRDFTGKADFEYAYNYRHKLHFGASYTIHAFAPGTMEEIRKNTGTGINSETTYGETKRIIGHEAALYLEDDIRWSNRLRTLTGLRISSYFSGSAAYFNLEPRISLRYSLTHKLAFKASYSRMTQYLHLLANSGLGMPTDLWLPSTGKIRPEYSHQITASLERTIADNWVFSIEGFYKWLYDVIDYQEGVEFNYVQKDWEETVGQGIGLNYGLEILLAKRYGDVTGILAYTLSWNKRQADFINRGNWYYYRYDRRHQINFTTNLDVSDRSSIAFSGVFGTGYPVTFPHGRYIDINGHEVFDYEMKNGYRLRYYLRFDVAVNLKRDNPYAGFKQELIISVYNLFNRRNPYSLYIGTNAQGELVAKELSIIPLFPSITYRLSF